MIKIDGLFSSGFCSDMISWPFPENWWVTSYSPSPDLSDFAARRSVEISSTFMSLLFVVFPME